METENAIVLSSPEVSNRININMNQDDLIQMVVEQKTEEMRALLMHQHSVTEKLKVALETAMNEAMDTMKAKAMKSAIYAKFKKVAALNGGEVTVSRNNTYGLFTLEKQHPYEYGNIDNAEDSKDPIRHLQRNVSRTNIIVQLYTGGDYKFTAEKDGVQVYSKIPVKITDVEATKALAKAERVAVELAKAYTAEYQIQKDYLYIKYGERRIKAQITKASLKKSKEGKALLGMLEQATNIKLLG